MINLSDRVAIFIDADNVNLDYTEQVLKLAEYYGEVKVCRAFGDWEQSPLASWREKMPKEVECIQVDRVGKNATDHRLLLDIGKMLQDDAFNYDFDHWVSVVIVVSNDGDFTSACQYLREEEGKDVVVICRKDGISNALRENCDKIHVLEDLDDELKRLKEEHPIPPSEIRDFWHGVLCCMDGLFQERSIDWTHWISLAEADKILHEVWRDYEGSYGKYKLSEWLKYFDWYVELDGQKIRQNPTYARYSRLRETYQKTLIYHRQFDHPLKDVTLPVFGTVLRKLTPDYDGLFGSKKLSTWLKDYPEVFEINGDVVTLRRTRYRHTGKKTQL
ncbi:MAG TPA: NYN domain-containing protein [Aggregatilineaceae bacterium]|nr:NYN domain-containing protein [Aggregatilineaceae bacterium]